MKGEIKMTTKPSEETAEGRRAIAAEAASHIWGAFTWEDTREGHKYWSTVVKRLEAFGLRDWIEHSATEGKPNK